jgi:small subunit ribosomal protein S1
MTGFDIGEEIETSVVQVSNDTVFIDLGLKSEGFVDKSEFCDEEGKCSVKEGDRIKVYFVGSKGDDLHFTTKIKGENAGSEVLENAFSGGLPVEGHVEKEIKGGFEVKIGSARAFCPYSQMGYKNRLEPSEYIGRTLSFLITEYKNEGKNIIISNRRFEEQKEMEKVNSLSSSLSEGSVVKGIVKSIQSYGAFVDINGFQALLPVSEISHQRIEKIEDFLSAGQVIEAKVIRADWNSAHPDRSKVSLSLKALEKDPWESLADSLKAGDKISGKIVRIAGFGLFVNLKPGIDGLVHISALNDVSTTTNLSKKYSIGQEFDVVIEKIDLKEKRISLAPASSVEQDKETASYMAGQDDDEGNTYNPFAALLKK